MTSVLRLIAYLLFFSALTCAVADIAAILGYEDPFYRAFFTRLPAWLIELPVPWGALFSIASFAVIWGVQRFLRQRRFRKARSLVDFSAQLQDITLDDADKDKINSEVNQILHQRFLLSSGTLTLFVGYAAILAQTSLTTRDGRTFLVISSGVLLLVLCILFTQSYFLRRLQRTYGAYMRLTGASRWEQDFNKFRKLGYFAYTKVEALLYIVLTSLSAVMPFVLLGLQQAQSSNNFDIIILTAFGLFAAIFMTLIAFFDWFGTDIAAEAKWRSVLAIKPTQPD